MRLLLLTTLLTTILLSGCGSFLAVLQTNSITDNPGERTMGQQIEDETIETKAIVNIHSADDGFDQAHISVVSYNAYVLVAGQVHSRALKDKATQVIRKIRNVRRIHNELEISAPSSAMTRTSDTWITAKVKSWLLGNADIEGGRVKVLTENGVVYLMGLATRAEADRITAVVSSLSGVQKVVGLFEYID